ncbi:MAG: flagellar biosynthesis protein FlgC [Nitrospirae bacterium]|nr:MAG: flagellar biosynthesis protein FlgC [Nitrospirota bacterium]
MIGPLYSSLSGMAAAQTKLASAAHNIANANTEGFKKQRVLLQESTSQGVKATVEQVKTPGPVLMRATETGLVEVEQSNVELNEEVVAMIRARRLYESNSRAVESANESLGHLLDMME